MKPGERRGYSLLECLIVLCCAAVMLTLSVPGMYRLHQEWTLWGCARSVESSLRWGRARSISSNTSLLFEVSRNGSRYCWIDAESGQKYVNTGRRLPAGVRIESHPARSLRFYPHGNAVPAGTYVVRASAGSYSVVVNPGGRIRIKRN
ncbi:MAG: GspH/FimT family pseudopilin [Acidobacteria bacterium]|nr:GspH/FimT family pseudopilin [Acidobacteriota bacterium]